MKVASRLFATLLLGAVSAFAIAAPVTPTGNFGPLPAATYGGSGIPNNPSQVATVGTLTLGLVAHQRFVGPNLANDGAGTYFANAGFGTPPGSSIPGALWNFGYYLNDTAGLFQAGRTYQLLYDLDAGTNTDQANLGVINFGAAVTPGTFTVQDSQNLAFGFLSTGIPGIVTPPSPAVAFNPFAAGQYSFALVAFQDGQEILRSAINVQVAAVPEPGVFALMGLGLAGLAVSRRRKQVK